MKTDSNGIYFGSPKGGMSLNFIRPELKGENAFILAQTGGGKKINLPKCNRQQNDMKK